MAPPLRPCVLLPQKTAATACGTARKGAWCRTCGRPGPTAAGFCQAPQPHLGRFAGWEGDRFVGLSVCKGARRHSVAKVCAICAEVDLHGRQSSQALLRVEPMFAGETHMNQDNVGVKDKSLQAVKAMHLGALVRQPRCRWHTAHGVHTW